MHFLSGYLIPSLIWDAVNIPLTFNLRITSPRSLHLTSRHLTSDPFCHLTDPILSFVYLSYLLEVKVFKDKDFTFSSLHSLMAYCASGHKYMIYIKTWLYVSLQKRCLILNLAQVLLNKNEDNIFLKNYFLGTVS